MIYTIHVGEAGLVYLGERTVRFQKDLSWRQCSIRDPLEASDFTSVNAGEAYQRLLQLRGSRVVLFDREEYFIERQGRLATTAIAANIVHFHTRAFFGEIPPDPDIQSLRDAFRETSAGTDFVLTLGVDGIYRSFPVPDDWFYLQHYPSIVARFEHLEGGSASEREIQSYYSESLLAWELFLRTGFVNEYIDTFRFGEHENALEEVARAKAAMVLMR